MTRRFGRHRPVGWRRPCCQCSPPGWGLGLFELLEHPGSRDSVRLTAFWLILYGGALHATGFFMQRGIKLLGWLYVLIGLFLLCFSAGGSPPSINENAVHWLMGLSFGIINLTYGVYLKLTLDSMETE